MSENLLIIVIYESILLCSAVQGTLTPDGTVPLDCGSQQTFTCSVTSVAAWIVRGLSGISLPAIPTGLAIANNNSRITTADTSGVTQSSTITITGFNTSDNGGTIQCIDLVDNSVQGMASISVGPPSCSVNFTHVRIDNITNVTWQQLPDTLPVTSTIVTYCPTSSPNCGNSMNCTSPCTISGLDPCVEYNLSAIPTNNCGSATGCTGSMVTAKGIPSCLNGVNLVHSTLRNNDCDVSLTWQQSPNTPPVTSTTVTYCPTSSPNCRNSRNCTSPCTISGLLNDTEYQFTVIPNNNCGSPTGCTGNTVTHKICSPRTTDSTQEPINSTVLIICVVVAVVLLALIIAIITIILICCLCPGIKTCFVMTCCCKSGSDAKNKPPREEQPHDDYADPQTVRDNKEMTEENGITYAALQFSEEAGGNGKNGIHRREELGNVQYSEVERLQV